LEREAGVEVVEVVTGSPAHRAGLRPEDIVLDLDGVPVESARDLQRLMAEERIGRRVPVRVVREGRVLELTVEPDELS
jgi:S1-C subfamily serine protease